ncbi:MAG: hypothetical protein CL933_12385 [Deltaproteobacteria bacterium]|nr:hypothetical protein [Deltaproteobacteria bacterium]
MSNPGRWTRQDVLIVGRWVPAANGIYSIVDPSTEEAVGEAPDASALQVHEACRAARKSFEPRNGPLSDPHKTRKSRNFKLRFPHRRYRAI